MRLKPAAGPLATTCLLLACCWQVATTKTKTTTANSDMTGCDLWFSLASTSGRAEQDNGQGNKTLVQFCECRDSPTTSEQLESIQVDHQHQLSQAAVGQLDCGANGDQAAELLNSFEMFLRLAAMHQIEFRVDYLTVRINSGATSSLFGSELSSRLQANQLAISFVHLQQLQASLSLVQLERLQSLALSVEEPLNESGPSSEPPDFDTRQLNIAMLNNLTALQRLEISLDHDDHRRQVSSASSSSTAPLILDLSKQSHKLKWLSVSSYRRPVELATGSTRAHDTNSALTSLSQLEHLSLEWNQLEQFPLFVHFPQGHANLSTLNLANNKLMSLMEDFLCCGNQSTRGTQLRFSSLSQLDLSSNELEAIGLEEARTMRAEMPNLSNLFLQHNKIKHLHLSALLGSIPPYSAHIDSGQPDRAPASQLEFIDLSHNQISSLLTVQLKGGVKTRLRAINLAHNFLRRPLSLISSKLMQVLEANSTGELATLESLYELSESGLVSSLCDHLSSLANNSMASPMKSNQFQAVESTLAELLLDHNKLERVERRHFQSRSCSSLEILRLNDNQISVIEQEAFKYMSNLQELDLGGNNLIELPGELFADLRELRLLNLAHNSLAGRLDLVGVFGSASLQPEHLHELRLANNKIEQLELWPAASESNGTTTTTTTTMTTGASGTRLELLDLAHNQLTLSSESSLKLLLELMSRNYQLTEVRLEGNKVAAFDWLQVFERDALDESDSKRFAKKPEALDKNRAKQSRKQVLKVDSKTSTTSRPGVKSKKAHQQVGTKADRKRSARHTQALIEPLDDRAGPTSGSALVLSNNRLGSFGRRPARRAEAMPNNSSHCQSRLFMRSLQTLLLDNNSIRELTSSSFACLEALEVLDLHGNQLRILDELAFSRLDQLRQLNLADNNLIRVAPRHFESCHLLIKLDLSRNQLTSFEWLRATRSSSNSTEGFALEWLDLSGNQALRMNGAELWPLLAAPEGGPPRENIDSSGLRQLDLSGVMSVWSPRQSLRQTTDRLSLEELELGDIGQLDWSFLEQVLDGAERLKRLRVSVRPAKDKDQSSLTEDVARLFASLKSAHKLYSLAELSLSNGQLTNEIISKSIESSTKLMPPESHAELVKMNVLDLSRNLLVRWPFEATESGPSEFLALDQLLELNLSQNRLSNQLIGPSSTTKNETLRGYGLANLEKLNLSSNSLTGLLAYKMHEERQLRLVELMPRLRQLDLAHNKLSWLPAGFFANSNRLELLDLSHNRLVWSRAHHLRALLTNTNSMRLLDISFNAELFDQFEMPSRKSPHFGAPLSGEKVSRGIGYDLIIRRERPSGAISCSPLEKLFGFRSQSQLKHQDHNQPEEASGDGQEQPAEVRCANHLARIAAVNLDGCCKSMAARRGAHERVGELLDGSKLPASVSLAQNGLSSLEAAAELLAALSNESNMTVVHLDVSGNNLSSNLKGEPLCEGQPQLRSLELRDQSGLTEFKLASLRHCRQLAFLDLSHNRVSSIGTESTWTQIRGNLLALDLAHNHLSHLSWLAQLAEANPDLRQLDLRSNRLREANSFEWALERIRLSRPLLTVFVHHPLARDSPNGRLAPLGSRHRLEVTQDESGLRIRPDETRGPTRIPDSKLVIDLNPIEGSDSDRRLVYEVDASISHLFLFCSMRRQLAHRLCLNSTSNNTETLAPALTGCLSFRPPKGPTCLTKLEAGAKVKPVDQAIGPSSSSSSSSSHFVAEANTEAAAGTRAADQSDWLLSLIEAIRRNWIKLKQFDLGAHLARVSQIKQDSVLFYVASGDGESSPLPVHTLSLVKFGLATAAFCVVLLAIAMFVLLNSGNSHINGSKTGRCSKQAPDSSAESSARDDPTLSSSSSTTTSTSHSRHRLRPAAHATKSTSNSPGGSAFLDNSSATFTTTTTTGGAGGQTGGTTRSSRSPTCTGTAIEAVSQKLAPPHESRDEQLILVSSSAIRGAAATGTMRNQQQQQQLYGCCTPSSSLAPSSVETGETMQAVDSLQGSTGGSTLCYQSPQLAHEPLVAGQLTLPVHSVDQYQVQRSIYGQLAAAAAPPPVATVMRMVKSSTFNNANALNYAAPSKPAGQLGSQTISRNTRDEALRKEPAATAALSNHYSLLVPQSISLMSVAGVEPLGGHPSGHAADLHELDPATLSLLSLNSQLSGREKSADASGGLCHYHSKFLQDPHRQQQQQQQQQQLAGYTILNQTLLERDETNYATELAQDQPDWTQDQLEYPAPPSPNP